MKKLLFALLFHLITTSVLFSQSLATNILFEQANVVFKGRVQKIQYIESDAEGDDFVVTVIAEKFYKSGFDENKIGIRTTKLYDIDTTLKQILMNYKFQIQKDSVYAFFIQRPEEYRGDGRFIYFTDFADDQIEGIPFSSELEKELTSYDQMSYLTTNDYGRIPFKILFQSSPLAVAVTVQKIKSRKGWYAISGVTATGAPVMIKTKGLNCICEKGSITEKEVYLFFLTPFDEGKYLLTDRWLGAFQLDAITKSILKFYQSMKDAAGKGQDDN